MNSSDSADEPVPVSCREPMSASASARCRADAPLPDRSSSGAAMQRALDAVASGGALSAAGPAAAPAAVSSAMTKLPASIPRPHNWK
jgi:hypothetical protein